MPLTPQQIRKHATRIIRSAVEDIEYGAIGEMLEDALDGYSDDAHDKACRQVDAAIRSANVDVTWRGDAEEAEPTTDTPSPVHDVAANHDERPADRAGAHLAGELDRRGTVDPQDTCRPGDPDPNSPRGGDSSFCGKRDRDDWTCTRDAGHSGQHVAGNGRNVYSVWPQG